MAPITRLLRSSAAALLAATATLASASPEVSAPQESVPDALGRPWQQLSEGPWGPREGLMVASVGDRLILTGGRGTKGVGFSGGTDVWISENGTSWARGEQAAWGRRAYHVLLGPDEHGCIFLMGGQTFSQFFNDVWKSCDEGRSWTMVTQSAGWKPRAGLGGTMHKGKLFVAGGCHDNVKYDPGLFRQFYSDVWSSSDGETWELVTESPGWSGRSGPRLVSFQDKLFIIAGERGFTKGTQLGDVWSSSDDGKTWSELTAAPTFSPRSGHGVVTYGGYMVLIAGWPELSDIYYSQDGAHWTRSKGQAWNCNSTECGKFDFWPVIHKGKLLTMGGSGSSSTFGKLYSDTWSLDLAQLPLKPVASAAPLAPAEGTMLVV